MTSTFSLKKTKIYGKFMRTQCLLHLLPSPGRKARLGLPRDSRGAEGSSRARPAGCGRAPSLHSARSRAAAGSRCGHTAAVQSTTCRAPRVRRGESCSSAPGPRRRHSKTGGKQDHPRASAAFTPHQAPHRLSWFRERPIQSWAHWLH